MLHLSGFHSSGFLLLASQIILRRTSRESLWISPLQQPFYKLVCRASPGVLSRSQSFGLWCPRDQLFVSTLGIQAEIQPRDAESLAPRVFKNTSFASPKVPQGTDKEHKSASLGTGEGKGEEKRRVLVIVIVITIYRPRSYIESIHARGGPLRILVARTPCHL